MSSDRRSARERSNSWVAIILRALLALNVSLASSTSWAQPAGKTNSDADGSPPADTLSAQELADWALERNPGLRAARATAAAAAHRVEVAGSLDDPTLSYQAAPNTAGSPDGLAQKIEFAQKLPWPGTLSAREEQARHEAAAAELGTDVLALEIVAAAKSAFAEWRYLAQAQQIHSAIHSLLGDIISTAETRYAAGRGLRQDVLQAQLERAEVEKRLIALRQTIVSTQARINALLRREPGAALPPAAPVPVLAEVPGPELLEQFALERHPSLRRLEAELLSRASEVELAEKAFYPDFQVGIGYNELWDDPDKRATVGLSISLPLDRSKYRAALDSAEARAQGTRWLLSEERAELLAHLAEASAQLAEERETIELYEQQLLPLTNDYLDAAIADYSAGTGAFLNVITAEQRKLATELALARARADYGRALAELEHWLGGSLPETGAAAEGERP